MELEDEIKDTSFGAPHVVILGAGASRAATPKGDKYGRKLPVMDDLLNITGLRSLLESRGVNTSYDNFENLYNDLCETGRNDGLVNEIEELVRKYFTQIRLQDEPTIYDYLVLSLRPKDLIATFNWDPLLHFACFRNYKKTPPPKIAYLHGNVAMGYCLEHKVQGSVNGKCLTCRRPYRPSKLLYPIKKKDYSSDPFIKAQWDTVRSFLKSAFVLTVFGYGAPSSDVEAVTLLKEGWNNKGDKPFEEVEVIDIKDEEFLREKWDSFIYNHHYRVENHFFASWIARHPRRTCEVMWNMLLQCDPSPDNLVPQNVSLSDLWNWYDPLVSAETCE